MSTIYRWIFVGILALTTVAILPTAAASAQQITTVVRGAEPFVAPSAAALCKQHELPAPNVPRDFCGYSIDVLIGAVNTINKSYGSQLHLAWQAPGAQGNDPDAVIRSVNRNQAQMAIGNFSQTDERLALVDFSQSIYPGGGIGVLVRAHTINTGMVVSAGWRVLSGQLHGFDLLWRFAQILAVVGGIVLVPAAIIYFAERRHSKSFLYDAPVLSGLADSAWWAITAIFGQEESHPHSGVSRMAATGLILAGVVAVSITTTTIGSSLALEQTQAIGITNANDLWTKKIGTVQGSTADKFLTERNIYPVAEAHTAAELYPLVQNGKLDAVVYDAAALQYYANHDGRGKVTMVDGQLVDDAPSGLLKAESYGVVLQKNLVVQVHGQPRSLEELINNALRSESLNGCFIEFHSKWFDNHGYDRKKLQACRAGVTAEE